MPTTKMKQQQAMMELYKKGRSSGLPAACRSRSRFRVFFSLYKVLFHHHRDAARAVLRLDPRLSAPDPTNIFTLFGAHSVSIPPSAGGRLVPSPRFLACDHGRHHVGADEAQSARPIPPSRYLQLDAASSSPSCWAAFRPASSSTGLEQLALCGASKASSCTGNGAKD